MYLIKPFKYMKFMYIYGHIVSMLLCIQMRLYFGMCIHVCVYVCKKCIIWTHFCMGGGRSTR